MVLHPKASSASAPIAIGRGGGASHPLRDPLLWLVLAVFAANVALYLAPLDPSWVRDFGTFWGIVPLVAADILAVTLGLRAVRRARDRRFWTLVALGLAFHLAVPLLYMMPLPGTQRGALTIDVAYGLFYFSLLRAARVRPDRRGGREDELVGVETLATAVFLVGLLVYFVVLPDALTPDSYRTWAPSLLLYVTLDLYLAAHFLHAWASAEDAGWRTLYGWFVVVTLGWAATDTFEAFFYVGWVGDVDPTSVVNVVWYVPYTLLGVAARLRTRPWPRARTSWRRAGRHPRRPSAVGPVVLYALVLPALHFGSNLLGLLDPATRDAREAAVLIVLPLLVALAYAHQRLLERRARRLEDEGRVLEAQRAVLAAAIEQARTALAVAGTDRRIEYANRAWQECCNATGEDLTGRSVDEVLERVDEQALALWRSAHPTEPRSLRLRRTTPDGGTVEEDFSISPALDERGTLTHWTLSLRDVTRESVLERQLRQAGRMEALGTLAGGIAHDFNNMLAAILGYSELALDHPDLPPEIREDLQEILRAAERAKALTGQVLTFSRQGETERRRVHLGQVVADALRLVRPTIPPGVALVVDADPERGPVLAQESQLHQVVMNLVSNAVHAVGGQGTLRVAVEEAWHDWAGDDARLSVQLPAGRYTTLVVSDDGAGMDRRTMERLYDPFFTTKELGHGTGLGLSVVHGIVAAHGGAISVESEVGRGTTFRIFLPVGGPPAPTTGDAEDPCVAPRFPAHVLLVDDEPLVASALAAGLRRAGYRVTEVHDPREALAAFLAAPRAFHVLLTDQTMPELSGLELAAEVHRLRPSLPAFVLTGYSDSVTPERVREAGVVRVLYKPLSRGELVRAIEEEVDVAEFVGAAS